MIENKIIFLCNLNICFSRRSEVTRYFFNYKIKRHRCNRKIHDWWKI